MDLIDNHSLPKTGMKAADRNNRPNKKNNRIYANLEGNVETTFYQPSPFHFFCLGTSGGI